MAEVEFLLPKLGMSMMEGTVEEWHVTEGATIAEGQEIVTSAQFLLDSESNLREAIQKMIAARTGG